MLKKKTLKACSTGLVVILVSCYVLGLIALIVDAAFTKEPEQVQVTKEYPTFGTIRVSDSEGVLYEYKGGDIHIAEDNGKVLVTVDFPYERHVCLDLPKFQDKMSMDWDYEDNQLLLRFTELINPEGNAQVKAWNILTVLNRMLDDNYPGTISEVIAQELEQRGITMEDLQSVQITDSDVAAMNLIKYERWDMTDGSTAFQE